MSDDPWLPVIDQADIVAALQRKKSRDSRLVEQEAEITRLRAALATARREGMEDARNLLETLHKNHKYNPLTGEGSEHDVGYYRALAEGAAHILCAAEKEVKP